MLLLRSILFNAIFYSISFVICIVALPLLALPPRYTVRPMRGWVKLTLWLLRMICGTTHEIRGRERLPDGPILIAGKHQSMWDTLVYFTLFDNPAIVLKQELMWLPLYGWFARKARMISIDRAAGATAIRRMVAAARSALADNRTLVIFPEGTRAAPGSHLPYKPGIAALYRQLDVPCVPVALNSGLYWPRRRFIRRPGKIIFEFLEPIPAGMDRKQFMGELENRIEPATNALLEEAGFDLADAEPPTDLSLTGSTPA